MGALLDRLTNLARTMQPAPFSWTRTVIGDIAVVDRSGAMPAADIIARLHRSQELQMETRVFLRGPRGLWDELLHDGTALTATLLIGAETIEDAAHHA